MKHIVFVSKPEHFYTNEDLILKIVKNFKSIWKSVYLHIEDKEVPPQSNLVVLFESVLNEKFPEQKIDKFFKSGDVWYYSIKDFLSLETWGKEEIRDYVKQIKADIEVYMKRFALIRVTNHKVFYRDLNFNRCHYQNYADANKMYVPDENGEYFVS